MANSFRSKLSIFVVSLMISTGWTLATPQPKAEAATYTFFSGPACHGVNRIEGSASASLSRTGVYAWFRAPATTARLTIKFGSITATSWSNEGQVTGPRSYGKGSFIAYISGAVNGECANQSKGQLLNVPSGGMKSTPDDSPSLDATAHLPEGWESRIVESSTPGLNIMTVQVGNFEISSTFTHEQVKGDQAIIEIQINPDEPSVEVTYDSETQNFLTETLN